MPRGDRLSPRGVKLLQEKHLAILSTIMPDGAPRPVARQEVVPMADGARVYAGTYDGLQVLRLRGGQCELAAEAFSGAIVQAVGACRGQSERVFAGLRDGLHRTDDAGLH